MLYAHLAILADVNHEPAEALHHGWQAKQVVADYGLEAVPHVFLAQIVSAWLSCAPATMSWRSPIAPPDGPTWPDVPASARGRSSRLSSQLAHFDRIRGDYAGKLAWLDEAEAVLAADS